MIHVSRFLSLGTAVLAIVAFAAPAVLAGDAPPGDAYSLDTCPVSGMKLGGMGAPVVLDHDGREIRFCCKGCVPRFQKDAETYLKKIDAAVVAAQRPIYPLQTCVVTRKPLAGEKVKPVEHVYKNRLVRLRDERARATFASDPAKYLERLDAAVVKMQMADYPLETCVITGSKLGSMGKPVDYVQANRLVRFCCKGCVKAFRKNPGKALAKIDAAWGDEDEDEDEIEPASGGSGGCGGGDEEEEEPEEDGKKEEGCGGCGGK